MHRYPIAFGVCVLLASIAGEHGVPGLLKARADARRLSAEILLLQTENASLRAQVRALTADPAAIEATARRDLGWARADEVVVTVRR